MAVERTGTIITGMEAATGRSPASATRDPAAITRIAAGMDGFPEGEDAAALAAALADVTGSDLVLVAVLSDPLILPPVGVNWIDLKKEAVAMLRRARDERATSARTVVETDFSVPRALHRVVRREHRDLLVMGSSRQGPDGRVRIGKRTRQLLCHFECPLAIAPRGFSRRGGGRLRRIAVGYDGGPEAHAALELAASIASVAGAELEVDAVVDDRMPPLGRPGFAFGAAEYPRWEEAVQAEVERRRTEVEQAARRSERGARVEIKRGRPADALLELSQAVDLLVIGSRRWGPVSRLLLGSTGEALLHDAACPVLVVPRPAS